MRERVIHRAMVDLLRVAAHADALWFHIPNRDARPVAKGRTSVRMGLHVGVADFVVVHRGLPIFLELKHSGGQARPEQRAFGDKAARAGAVWAVADSLNGALMILKQHAVLPNLEVAA